MSSSSGYPSDLTRIEFHLPFGKPKEKGAALIFLRLMKFLRKKDGKHAIEGFTSTSLSQQNIEGQWWSGKRRRWMIDPQVVVYADVAIPGSDYDTLIPLLESFYRKLKLIYAHVGSPQDEIYLCVQPVGIVSFASPKKPDVLAVALNFSDVVNDRLLVSKILSAKDPALAYLRSLFNQPTLDQLAENTQWTPIPPELKAIIVDEFNLQIEQGNLWEEPAFSGLARSERTKQVAQQQKADVRVLSRCLIEDSCDGCFSPLAATDP